MTVSTIVLCAGEGTRMKGQKSKLLHEICGLPLCMYALQAAVDASDGAVVAVLGSRGDSVQKEIEKHFGERITFVWQREQKGTAHAVQQALAAWKDESDTIMVSYGDVPLMTNKELIELQQAQKKAGALVAILTATGENPFGYGRIVRNDAGLISAIVEENDASEEQKLIRQVNAGLYAFDGAFLRANIGTIKASKKGEFYLTDMVALAHETGKKAPGVVAVETTWQNMAGVNDRAQLADARTVIQQRILLNWMKKGVTVINPQQTYVDYSVRLAEDVVLEPGVSLRGECVVQHSSIIGTGSVLSNTYVGAGVHILPYCVCTEAKIESAAKLGPFSHLRKDSHVENDAHVGNFVELKNTTLRAGAKANHLAYIGDADIGAGSNVGAGTITCNYDGFLKHKTITGSGVFIGSNSTLVAPLNIGQNAYIAAGSTIVRDVPEDALALGRSRQENKEHYASALKKRLKKS